jgi:hypothetical protein
LPKVLFQGEYSKYKKILFKKLLTGIPFPFLMSIKRRLNDKRRMIYIWNHQQIDITMKITPKNSLSQKTKGFVFM